MFDNAMITLAQAEVGEGRPVAPTGGTTPVDTTSTVPGGGQPGTGVPVPPTGKPSGGFDAFLPLIFLAIIAVFWFMMMSSQRKEKKRREAMLTSLNKGDKVLTLGGMIGTVVEVRESEVVLKVDEAGNTRIKFSRAAIQTVLTDKTEPAKS